MIQNEASAVPIICQPTNQLANHCLLEYGWRELEFWMEILYNHQYQLSCSYSNAADHLITTERLSWKVSSLLLLCSRKKKELENISREFSNPYFHFNGFLFAFLLVRQDQESQEHIKASIKPPLTYLECQNFLEEANSLRRFISNLARKIQTMSD